jgi:hypothetical protein
MNINAVVIRLELPTHTGVRTRVFVDDDPVILVARNTRGPRGPPIKGPKISNEGPAQPALRRLGLRQKGGCMGSA